MSRRAALGWVTATAVVSLLYWWMGVQPSVPRELRAFSDDVLHAGAYLVLAALASIAALAWSLPRPLLIAPCYAVAHGLLLELLQLFNPPRRAEVGDVVADLLGAGLGAALVWLVRRARP